MHPSSRLGVDATPRTATGDSLTLDAKVGRHGRGYDLGYKLHVPVDYRMILSLASVLVLANMKRRDPMLVERTRLILRRAEAKFRNLIADSQYNSGGTRDLIRFL